MATGIKHTLLRELKLRLAAYDFLTQWNGVPPSVDPVMKIAREIAENYARVRVERNADHAVYNRQLREQRTAAGLCRRCGKAPPRPQRVTCAECGRRDAASDRRRQEG